MGIFATRPEEPFEWAGLPSEPLRPESEAEHLDVVSVDALGLVSGGVESIVLSVAPSARTADTTDESGQDDG